MHTRLEEGDPRQALMERLVQHEAFARVERERADRRRRMLNRLSLGFFARG
jgi:1,6-anhydro-N-acetylmuramate kinase